MALFGVKLDAGDAAASGGGGEGLAVGAAGDGALRVGGLGVVAVDEIDVAVCGEPGPERVRGKVERVPADLRDFEAGSGEAFYFSAEEAEAADAGGLFTFLKEHLVADADAEEWATAGEPRFHRLPKAALAEAADAVAKGADAGEDDLFGAFDFGEVCGETHVSAVILQGVEDAANVAGAVVDECNHEGGV